MNYKFVQIMNMKDKKITESQADLDILRKISKNPDTTQRKIANDLGVSLGKVNYCLIKLKEKGIIKINNFANNPKKSNYMYLLTPKGIALKTNLIINFMKKNLEEYDKLKNELKK
jgi:EPS-associated MarR family transcriptional regulator